MGVTTCSILAFDHLWCVISQSSNISLPFRDVLCILIRGVGHELDLTRSEALTLVFCNLPDVYFWHVYILLCAIICF
jgi:hypothetical protein